MKIKTLKKQYFLKEYIMYKKQKEEGVMKKEMILTWLCLASLQAIAATQEVELKPTKIRGGGRLITAQFFLMKRKM